MRPASILLIALLLAVPVAAAEPELGEALKNLDARVIVRGQVRQPPLASMLPRDAEAGLRLANAADRRAFDEVKTRADWERFRDVRLQALRASLGQFPPAPKDLKVRVTRTAEVDGYRVDNIVYQTRPGLVVTANLYRPAKVTTSMPGILFALSHQRPKHDGQRQDIAMTWARAGCLVLVPDHIGHGERRQHPFGEEGQHDYLARYDAGIQLHLIGESLMGWMAYDLMRGIDVLLAEKGTDPKRILIVSEPAGGGDVAAVTAALDPRITGVMVQNFGGPQPETPYPLAKDAEQSFTFTGSGSWESTRNLRLSARDGFLPWMIDAAVAPRRLIYDHEFYWDREQDPVWKRLQRVYGFYNANDSLVGVAGHGFVVGSAPENSHWLPVNRELLYPILERWFSIPNPKKEYSKRLPIADLQCLTPGVSRELQPQPLHVLANHLASERLTAARAELARLEPAQRRERLRQTWTRLLGDVAPAGDPVVRGPSPEREQRGSLTVERIHLATEPGIVVPVLLLLPDSKEKRLPVVVAVAQEGKQELLRQRSGPVAELLASGVAVCLMDVRGTGETAPGESRGRASAATSVSASEWMRGQSVLGGRLRDLRSVLRHLRSRPDLDAGRIALWGESFAAVNPSDRPLTVPHNAAQRPAQSEPLGGLLALLGALFEDDVRAVYVRGGLSDYQSALEGPYCYLPHDAVVSEVLSTGDMADLTAGLAPRPVRLTELVDGMNRKVSPDVLARRYQPAHDAYARAKAAERLRVGERDAREPSVAAWLKEQLMGR
jgi:cephalosporin-C deacetylase-like acetyl esterase